MTEPAVEYTSAVLSERLVRLEMETTGAGS
jgi:hypothetical protein